MIAAMEIGQSPFLHVVVKCLAVLGGFIAGFILIGLLYNAVDRALLRRQSPLFAHRGLRVIGGIAGAFLVAMYVFTGGPGGGATGGNGTQDALAPQPISIPVVNPDRTSVEPATGTVIRVVILGGSDVQDLRFYLVNDDTTPHTLDEVRTFALKARDAATVRPTMQILHSERNALPSDHPAVKKLESLAAELGIGIAFPKGR